MINNIREMVDFVKSMDDFVAGIAACEATGNTINQETINDISEIRPDILEYVEVIKNFITSQKTNTSNLKYVVSVDEPEPEEIEETVTEEPVISKTKNKYTKHKQIKLADAEIVIKFIHDECNKLTIDTATKKVLKRFSSLDLNDRSFTRIVNKETFTKVSDKFFVIKKNKIIALDAAPETSTPEATLTNPSTFVREFSARMNKDSFAKLLKIIDVKGLYQIIEENPRLLRDELMQLVYIELDRFNNGCQVSSIEALKGLLVLDIMSTIGATKPNTIRKNVFNKYKINVDNDLIISIKDHKILPVHVFEAFE